jgi:hypothetical protein
MRKGQSIGSHKIKSKIKKLNEGEKYIQTKKAAGGGMVFNQPFERSQQAVSHYSTKLQQHNFP